MLLAEPHRPSLDRRRKRAAPALIDGLEQPDRASDSARPSTDIDDSQPTAVNQERKMTEEELQDKLRAFHQHLEHQGYKPGPLGFRMDGASRFALFLAGRPLRKGEGPPDDWRGR